MAKKTRPIGAASASRMMLERQRRRRQEQRLVIQEQACEDGVEAGSTTVAHVEAETVIDERVVERQAPDDNDTSTKRHHQERPR
jgi:hypothetical protein